MKIKAKSIPNPIASIIYVQNGGLAGIGSRSSGLFFISLINLSPGISFFFVKFWQNLNIRKVRLYRAFSDITGEGPCVHCKQSRSNRGKQYRLGS